MGIKGATKKQLKSGLDFYMGNYQMSYGTAKSELCKNYGLTYDEFSSILNNKC